VSERIGPHVSLIPERRLLECTGCVYLKHNLLKSGRNPDWECLCLHPKAMEQQPKHRYWSGNGSKGRWIGEHPETPTWCPVRNGAKE